MKEQKLGGGFRRTTVLYIQKHLKYYQREILIDLRAASVDPDSVLARMRETIRIKHYINDSLYNAYTKIPVHPPLLVKRVERGFWYSL